MSSELNQGRWFATLRARAGLDFHVLLTLLYRGWSIVAGGATVLFLVVWLSPTEQGYYFTFASILGLQIFFELGMNQVVTQFTSHEFAHLKIAADGSLQGEPERISRLASLVKTLRRWYLTAAGLFLLAVGTAGIVFFHRNHDLPLAAWLGPWLTLSVAAAINLYWSPSLAMIEGIGNVGEVARLRLFQSIAGYGLMLAALALGLRLWAAPMVGVCAAVGTGLWLRHRARLLGRLRSIDLIPGAVVDWWQEIFPFQWRIALSWISGYFIFQLMTPMIFSHQGAAQAGRFGLALTVLNAIQTVGMSWISSKGPRMAALISRDEREPLKATFLKAHKASSAFIFLACLGLLATVWIATRLGLGFVHRVSPLETLVALALATIVNSQIFAMAVFMRAHKEEPMLPVSVVLAVVVIGVVYWASRVSVDLTASLYCVATFLALPWTVALFLRYWRRA